MPQSGLDPSWKIVIDYAYINNMQFGEQIIFTNGPLGNFWFPSYTYTEQTYSIAIVIAIVIAIALYKMVKDANYIAIIFGLTSVLVGLWFSSAYFWYIIPILFIIHALEHKGREFFILSLFLVLLLSFSVLVRFSYFPVTIISILLADFYRYYQIKAKIPIYLIVFIVTWLLLFVLSGQNILNFYSYFIGSFHTLSGYSDSMNIFGENSIIYSFIFLFAIMYIFLLRMFYQNISLKLFLFSLISSLTLFMAFKQGFVRHDGHAISAFTNMSFIFGILYIYYSKYFVKKQSTFVFISLILVASIFSTFYVIGYYTNEKAGQVVIKHYGLFKYKLQSSKKIFSKAYKQTLNNSYISALDKIKSEFPIDIKGTVDIYPWDQSYVIANNLEFHPRPLFQSYSVFSPYLIEKNKQFLISNKSAENILFTIKEIDDRLPSTMEGASWLEIMSRYDLLEKKGEFLHLIKRDKPHLYKLENELNISAKFNEVVQVPQYNTFVKIDIKHSFFGKIVNTLYKSPLIFIELEFKNGTKLKKRIIPNIVSSGFILSPYIEDNLDFYSYSIGENAGKEVVSFKIINESKCCYKNDIKITFQSIEREKKNISNIPESFRYLQFLKSIENYASNAYIYLNNYKNSDILFSHVGTYFEIESRKIVDFIKKNDIKIGYGIFDSAYTGSAKSKGACFIIYKNEKINNNIIYKNCINPLEIEVDRKEHYLKLQNIEKTAYKYIFEVAPRDVENGTWWGWSYWNFEVVDEPK